MSNSNKLQNKKSKINEEEEIKREAEDKAKMEAERKAQSIQDKAKMEAERKAQSIKQQAEDKARAEAEQRTIEIKQQAEDKARAEAEQRTIEIKQQAEDKARAEADEIKQSMQIITSTNDSYPQVESKNFKVNSSNNTGFFDPFMKSVSIWQNYSIFWMNLTKEIISNSTRMTNDFQSRTRK
jgi:hypothetical protein